MDFKQELGKLKVAIDRELECQFDREIAKVIEEDLLLVDALIQAKKIALSGGKRIRGALLCWAYFAVGGKEKKKILKVAAAIELVHLFFLVHDDVMDRGRTRHGQETVNVFFAKKKFAKKDEEHFGDSMAIIAGDMLYAMAIKIIAEAGFNEKIFAKTLLKLQSIVAATIIGQSQDIAIAHKKSVAESQVLAIYDNKTAKYSFEGPLHMGAMLAGISDRKILQSFSNYAIPLGIAFQVQDDILGIFGNAKKFGKSTISDIEEGKQSLLVVWAKKKADAFQKGRIDAILGKKNLRQTEIKEFQNILKQTGALEHASNVVTKNFAKGKSAIEKAIILPKAKEFFVELIQYLAAREI